MAKEETRKVDTGIIQRGNSYRFTVSMGYDRNGKQIRKTTTFNPPLGLTQKQADKLAKEEYIHFSNRCKGLHTLKENMRFSDLIEEYKKLYIPTQLKKSTAYNYEHLIEYHFMDYFAPKKLKDINPAVISHFFATHKSKARGKETPLAPRTLKKLYTILQSVFTFAVSQGYIKETPCKNVILPRVDLVEEERKHLLPEELPTFLSIFGHYSPMNAIVLTQLFTGLRPSECLGLQWEDIDFENRKITLKHNLNDVAGKHELDTPKTKGSKRHIYMTDSLYNLLKKHLVEQKKLQLSLGTDFKHPEMVFTSTTGNYKDRSCLNSQFKKRLKDTGLEFMTLHKLRHTNATLLVNYGIDLKIVSEHLGHSDIKVTADTYAGVLDKSRIETAATMEQIIAEQTPNKHQTLGIG